MPNQPSEQLRSSLPPQKNLLRCAECKYIDPKTPKKGGEFFCECPLFGGAIEVDPDESPYTNLSQAGFTNAAALILDGQLACWNA